MEDGSRKMKRMIKKLFSLNAFYVSIFFAFLMVFIYLANPQALNFLELKALDYRFLIRGPIPPGPEVVIAVIDEKSMDEIGRWPWPRSKMAQLITALSDEGAKVVALDVGFWEKDENSNLWLIDRINDELDKLGYEDGPLQDILKQERLLADNDLILAKALKESKCPVVLGYFFHMSRDNSISHITEQNVQDRLADIRNGIFITSMSQDLSLDRLPIISAFMPEANIPVLSEAAPAAGYFNMIPDPDGTVRRVPLTIECQGNFYIPLSIQALRYAFNSHNKMVRINEIGISQVFTEPFEIPTDTSGRFLVNYRGPSNTFPHYSISDILNGRTPKNTFKDKIVLVGATAVGTYDMRVSPFESVFPGVEVHASVIDNVLRKDYLISPDWNEPFDLVLIVSIALLLGILLRRISALVGLMVALVMGVGLIYGNYTMFVQGTWVNIIYPLMTLIMVYLGITIFRYITEEREKKKIKGAFSFYVSSSVVSEILKNPEMLKLGGDKRIMTVLFSDIRGFTTISERMDPTALVSLLNEYLTAMSNVVYKYDGLVDKYIGDAVMAVWGAPLSQPGHALLACRTGLEMMSELDKLRAKWAEEEADIPFIDIGIGLNSGAMIVGNMGSEQRFDYTVMGDAVNLSSRLEGANKQYGTNIIIGEMTFEQVKEDLYCRELDSVAVKGKELPVRIFELMGEKGDVPEEKLCMARAFQRGLQAYRAQHWDEAERIFSAISVYYPDDKPTELYLERVSDLRKTPPPAGWNGVYVMKTK